MPNYFFSMETPRSPMLLQPFGEHLDQTRELRNTVLPSQQKAG